MTAVSDGCRNGKIARVRTRLRRGRAIAFAAETLNFFGLWLRQPRSIGAVAPSSETLADAIASEVDFDRPGVVVELGGGTGSITRALVERARNPRDIVVIEREAKLCTHLARRFPEVQVICGDARALPRLLRSAGVGPVKAVVSGLPLLSLPARTRYGIVRQAMTVLEPDGVLLQFTYGPLSPVGRSQAQRIGILGHRSGYIVRNLPPASLWQYRRDGIELPPTVVPTPEAATTAAE